MEDNTQEKKLDQKAIIKKKKRKIAIAGLAIAGFLAFSGISSSGLKSNSIDKFDLPNKNQVMANLDLLNVNEYDRSFLSILDNMDAKIFKEIKNEKLHTYVTRLIPPEDKSSIKINVYMNNLTDFEKNCFSNMIENFNTIFSYINSNYKFEINFNPNISSYIDDRCVNYFDHEFIFKKSNLGLAYTIPFPKDDTGELRRSNIYIATEAHKNFESVITHEFLHYLGLGDAYMQQPFIDQITSLSEVYSINSIMNSSAKHQFSILDLKLLSAIYCDLSDAKKSENFNKIVKLYNDNKIENYVNKSNVYSKHTLLTNEIINSELNKMGLETQENGKIEKIDNTIYTIGHIGGNDSRSLSFYYKEYGSSKKIANYGTLSSSFFDYDENLEYDIPTFECKSASSDIFSDINVAIKKGEDVYFKFGEYLIKLNFANKNSSTIDYTYSFTVEKIVSKDCYNNFASKVNALKEEYNADENKDEFFDKYLNKTFSELFEQPNQENLYAGDTLNEIDENSVLSKKIERAYNQGRAVKIKFSLPKDDELTR